MNVRAPVAVEPAPAGVDVVPVDVTGVVLVDVAGAIAGCADRV